jgi:hypothetical protein
MMKHITIVAAIAALTTAAVAAQNQGAAAPRVDQGRGAGAPGVSKAGHPDLNGTWLFSIGLPPAAIKRQTNGSTSIKGIDASGSMPAKADVPGALRSTPEPSYKPEFRAKVKDLFDHESKTDQVFFCGRPGIPRIGPPRRIIQLPNEMVFLYEDISGDPYRIIPTDGRPHRKDPNPTYYGDSVGRWEGNTLVVDVTGFNEETWFGEGGYFHSDAMHVTERFWRNGANLVYQVTVADPKVLTAPWTMAPRVVKPSTEALEESPRCVEEDGKLLQNDDHHGQR